MILAVDVDYREAGAVAAGVVFNEIEDAVAAIEVTVVVDEIADYEPGAFYKRELPCLLQLLGAIEQRGIVVDVVIVDGHVWLAPEQPGLGAHLYEALAKRVPVIGVAKNPWHDTSAHVAVVRGGAKALWVSAVGIDVAVAADVIQRMDGPHRLPRLLKRVDRLCRDTTTTTTTMSD